ncbi:hypothetical protein D3C77_594460 [compost metagenome]
MPEAVTRKVIKAASRSFGTLIAPARAPPMAPNRASPASAAIKAAGKAVNSDTNVAPNTPSSKYNTPPLTPAQ